MRSVTLTPEASTAVAPVTVLGDGGNSMAAKAVISLTTGLEDAEKVTVAFLVAVGAAETGRARSCF